MSPSLLMSVWLVATPSLVGSSAGDRYMSMSANLQRQEREYLDQSGVYQGTTETPDRYASAALVSASSKDRALPPVRTWVSRLPRLSRFTQDWSVVKPGTPLRDLVSE